MISTFNAFAGRTTRRVSTLLFGTAMLTACDADRVASPTASSARIPTPVKDIVYTPSATETIVIKTLGPGGALLAGASYTLLGPGPTLATVVDNGAYDNDNIPGTITLKPVKGFQWSVCQSKVPLGYMLAHPDCKLVNVYSKTTTTVDFFSPPIMSLSWDIRDWFGALMFPTKFTVAGPRGLGKFEVADNGANDLNPTWGYVTVKISQATVFTVCQTMASAGHYVASPPCKQADATSGRGIWVGTFVQPEAQVPSNP